MSLKQIAEGWFNGFLDDLSILDEETKSIGEKRMNICSECPVRTEKRCDRDKSTTNISGVQFNGCGCRIDKKTLCMDCQCPGGFW